MKKLVLALLAVFSLSSCTSVQDGYNNCTKVHIPEIGCVPRSQCDCNNDTYQKFIKYTDENGNVLYTAYYMFVIGKCPICDKGE